MTIPSRIAVALGASALVLITALAYWPGLAGGFLFDDFINLEVLGHYGGVRDGPSFWLYLTSGNADPTGRPLSMLSFLLDARGWPAEPGPFKRTNLLIHLLNTGLLAAVLQRLGRRLGLDPGHAARSALLGAALWGLHPLWVSTTLYVIQRQAMLPATFVLLALLLWESAWRRLEAGRVGAAWVHGFVGVGLASVCAVLSKANGALTPALVAAAWWLIYRPAVSTGHSPHSGPVLLFRPFDEPRTGRASPEPESMHHPARRLAFWALLLPSAVLALRLMWMIPGAIGAADSHRPWTLAERLLSQPRALWDYLGLLWIPREGSAGVYADDFPVSTGLLTPWTTLPALLGLAGLIGLALWLRRRQPAWALAIGFFLVGHVMESSIVPLDLYYEHRNYLPALLLFWPLATWLTGPARDKLATLRQGLVWALPLLLAALTFVRASVWGDPDTLFALLAERNAGSARSQQLLAQVQASAGRHGEAAERLRQSLLSNPDHPILAVTLISSECSLGGVTADTLATAERALVATERWDISLYRWFSRAVSATGKGYCPSLGAAGIERLLTAATGNPRLRNKPGWRQDVYNLRGQLALTDGLPDTALAWFADALRLEPNPDSALVQAAMLASAGAPGLALEHLRHYRDCCWGQHRPAKGMAKLHQWLKWRMGGYYETEFAHLEAVLREEAEQQREPAPEAGSDPGAEDLQGAAPIEPARAPRAPAFNDRA